MGIFKRLFWTAGLAASSTAALQTSTDEVSAVRASVVDFLQDEFGSLSVSSGLEVGDPFIDKCLPWTQETTSVGSGEVGASCDRAQQLQEQLPGLKASTIVSFLGKLRREVASDDEQASGAPRHSDAIVYFSETGFSESGRQALLHVTLVLENSSRGIYFLVDKGATGWEVKASARAWQS